MKKFNIGIKGVITKGGSVLVLKKNQENPFWEIPGGRIDADESIEQTIVREINEELPGSSDIEIKRILCAHRLPKDIGEDLGLMLIYFEISADLPDPIEISEEHSEIKWIKSLDEIEADGGTLKALEAIFSKTL